MATAVMHAFSLVVHLDPAFKLDRLLDPIPAEHHVSLVNRVRKDVNAFVAVFGPQAKGGTGELADDDGAE